MVVHTVRAIVGKGMIAKAYHNLPGLGAVYLEDSFVLDVRQLRNKIEFALDLVLNDSHRNFQAPRDGKQYCYCRATLVFREVVCAEWKNLVFNGSKDAAGESDFGNIDELSLCDGVYSLSGDWGELRVRAGALSVEFDS